MKNDNAVSWRITQLTSRLPTPVVTGLWIIRAASPDYQPVYEQMGILDMVEEGGSGEAPAETPWDAVAGARDGERAFAAAKVLRCLMPQSGLPEQIEGAALDQSEIQVLGELTEILSGLAPPSLAKLFPYPGQEGNLLSRYGGFTLPEGILRLLLGSLPLEPGCEIYDPCYGSGSLLNQAAPLLPKDGMYRFCAQAREDSAYQLGQVQAYLRGVSLELGSRGTDTLGEDLFPGREFQCILANPPFNQSQWRGAEAEYDPRWQFGLPPRSNGNFAWLQHVAWHLSERGRGAVILPNGTLTTTLQGERNIREGLLQAGMVEGIIALPAGIFSATKVPCCVWLLRGRGAAGGTTLFVDAQKLSLTEGDSEDLLKLTGLLYQHRMGLLTARTQWYAAVSLEEMERMGFQLSPNFYTRSQGLQAERLEQGFSQLAGVIGELEPWLQGSELLPLLEQWKDARPAERWEKAAISQLYQISGGIVKSKSAFGHGVPMADVAGVIRNPFLPGELKARVEVSPAELEKYRIQAGDILMNRSSENVEELASCCVVAEDREAVYGGYLKRLRPLRPDCPEPGYMAAYLRSGVYRQEIARVTPVYTTRSNINLKRLSQVNVYYPDKEMQEKLGKTMLVSFRYRENCFDQELAGGLERLEKLLIERFVTYPLLRMLEREASR